MSPCAPYLRGDAKLKACVSEPPPMAGGRSKQKDRLAAAFPNVKKR
jgi:hypothetical protein